MVVEDYVVESLLGGGERKCSIFAASCAERMAQLFTGLRDGSGRSADLDVFLESLDALWDFSGKGEFFEYRASSIEGFVELVPSEEGVVSVDGTYAFYGALVLMYSAQ